MSEMHFSILSSEGKFRRFSSWLADNDLLAAAFLRAAFPICDSSEMTRLRDCHTRLAPCSIGEVQKTARTVQDSTL
jgi:hypothetical protein